MAAIVSSLVVLETFAFKSAAGVLVTGKVNGDFTKRVLKDGVVSAVVATVTEVTSLSGYYSTSLTPTAVGNWTVIVEYAADPTFAWSESFTVIPAAADGSALATAIAAVQVTAAAISANVDVAVSSRATPGAYVTTGSVVSTSGDIEVRRGNAYLATDSRALPWVTTSASQWPTLTAATITLRAESKYDDRVTFTASGSVVTATGATKAVHVELTEAQTLSLTAGNWVYELHAVLSNGSDVELASGAMTVLEPLG